MTMLNLISILGKMHLNFLNKMQMQIAMVHMKLAKVLSVSDYLHQLNGSKRHYQYCHNLIILILKNLFMTLPILETIAHQHQIYHYQWQSQKLPFVVKRKESHPCFVQARIYLRKNRNNYQKMLFLELKDNVNSSRRYLLNKQMSWKRKNNLQRHPQICPKFST